MPAKLRLVANHYFTSLGLLKEPFPDPKDSNTANNPSELLNVVDEAQRLLADFIGSEAWEEIKNSDIIGREVPFFYQEERKEKGEKSIVITPLPPHLPPFRPLMRGFIDILYRNPEGQLVIGDYKTDKALDPTPYQLQARAYEAAVQRSLGEKAQFKLINLREGSTVFL